MPLNDFISDLAAKGQRTQELLDNRLQQADGMEWLDASRLIIVPSGVTTWVPARTGAGLYTMNRTAAGAEVHTVAVPVQALARINPNNGLAKKGFRVTGVGLAYRIQTVNATSVAATLNIATYTDGSAPTTATYGGTSGTHSGHAASALPITVGYHFEVLAPGSPVYQVIDGTFISGEFSISLPNTCIFSLLGGVFYVTHDYL